MVGSYTKGKIYDRVKGIVFEPDSEFENHNLGGFNPASGILRVNIDELRGRGQEALAARYARYFRGSNVKPRQVNIAHELGHGIDLDTVEEAEAHGIDVNKLAGALGGRVDNLSAMHNRVGWEHRLEPHPTLGDPFKVDRWRLNDALVVESREAPPTGYAAEHPKEDFGESFAIVSLGGDTRTIPERKRIVDETVEKAQARSFEQRNFTVKKADTKNGVYSPSKINALKLNVVERS